MNTTTQSRQDEDDKAKLAHALTKRLPSNDQWTMIQDMFGISEVQARMLINKGRRLDAQNIGRKA